MINPPNPEEPAMEIHPWHLSKKVSSSGDQNLFMFYRSVQHFDFSKHCSTIEHDVCIKKLYSLIKFAAMMHQLQTGRKKLRSQFCPKLALELDAWTQVLIRSGKPFSNLLEFFLYAVIRILVITIYYGRGFPCKQDLYNATWNTVSKWTANMTADCSCELGYQTCPGGKI